MTVACPFGPVRDTLNSRQLSDPTTIPYRPKWRRYPRHHESVDPAVLQHHDRAGFDTGYLANTSQDSFGTTAHPHLHAQFLWRDAPRTHDNPSITAGSSYALLLRKCCCSRAVQRYIDSRKLRLYPAWREPPEADIPPAHLAHASQWANERATQPSTLLAAGPAVLGPPGKTKRPARGFRI